MFPISLPRFIWQSAIWTQTMSHRSSTTRGKQNTICIGSLEVSYMTSLYGINGSGIVCITFTWTWQNYHIISFTLSLAKFIPRVALSLCQSFWSCDISDRFNELLHAVSPSSFNHSQEYIRTVMGCGLTLLLLFRFYTNTPRMM